MTMEPAVAAPAVHPHPRARPNSSTSTHRSQALATKLLPHPHLRSSTSNDHPSLGHLDISSGVRRHWQDGGDGDSDGTVLLTPITMHRTAFHRHPVLRRCRIDALSTMTASIK
jgi:hypothetical protein